MSWEWNWNSVLWTVFALCLVVIVVDNFYWVRDGTWFTSPMWSAITIFKWVAIAIICYVLVRPSSLADPIAAISISSEAKADDE